MEGLCCNGYSVYIKLSVFLLLFFCVCLFVLRRTLFIGSVKAY